MLDAELLQVINQIPGAIEKAFTAFIEKHPGHANQKTHGNRFGAGQAKESLRRLKDDKGARERYKDSHRKRQGNTQGVNGKSSDIKPGKREIILHTGLNRTTKVQGDVVGSKESAIAVFKEGKEYGLAHVLSGLKIPAPIDKRSKSDIEDFAKKLSSIKWVGGTKPDEATVNQVKKILYND